MSPLKPIMKLLALTTEVISINYLAHKENRRHPYERLRANYISLYVIYYE